MMLDQEKAKDKSNKLLLSSSSIAEVPYGSADEEEEVNTSNRIKSEALHFKTQVQLLGIFVGIFIFPVSNILLSAFATVIMLQNENAKEHMTIVCFFVFAILMMILRLLWKMTYVTYSRILEKKAGDSRTSKEFVKGVMHHLEYNFLTCILHTVALGSAVNSVLTFQHTHSMIVLVTQFLFNLVCYKVGLRLLVGASSQQVS